jgi:hypothetical protein
MDVSSGGGGCRENNRGRRAWFSWLSVAPGRLDGVGDWGREKGL